VSRIIRRRQRPTARPHDLGEHRNVVGNFGIRLGAVVNVGAAWVAVCGDCRIPLDPCETDELAVGTLSDHWAARHPGVAA
jgi:hypothetical protein